MKDHSSFRNYARALRHFTSTRGLEVVALQASPLLGCVLGGFRVERGGVLRFALLLFGSTALTAHVFVLNDWAGHATDMRNARRAKLAFVQRGITSRRVARIAIALLIAANFSFAGVGSAAIVLGAGIAALSLVYSCSPAFGKSTPVIASINHLLGGALHFLLGYSLSHALDARGLLISLFFGLVFAAGHLNQEVRDHEGDLLNGIRTTAVAFGCRRAFVASLCTFTAAYALLVTLARLNIMPRLLMWTAILWPFQFAWALSALKRGLGFETAVWMQQRYRLLFAVIGIAMLLR